MPVNRYDRGMSDPTPSPTLVLVRDLLFSSKITAAARASGIAVKVVRDPAKLEGEPGRRLIVDLNAEGNLQFAIKWKTKSGGEVIGFVSHVAGDAIAEARRLGVDRILSNGGFSANVDSILKA
jgi:hypothetical protein